jgi:hypothetical protein
MLLLPNIDYIINQESYRTERDGYEQNIRKYCSILEVGYHNTDTADFAVQW